MGHTPKYMNGKFKSKHYNPNTHWKEHTYGANNNCDVGKQSPWRSQTHGYARTISRQGVNKRNEKSREKNKINYMTLLPVLPVLLAFFSSLLLFLSVSYNVGRRLICMGLQMCNRAICRNCLWCLGGTPLYALPNEGLEILEKEWMKA